MNEDFLDILEQLVAAGARFIVVGAHALAVHGIPRATGDLDLWIGPGDDNARRVMAALVRFGAPVQSLGINEDDLRTPGMVVQIGLPPRRIDVMTRATGVDFEQAWSTRVLHTVGEVQVPFISRDMLIANKRATGRPRDLADIAELEQAPGEA